jgi:hypothetical protein
MIINILKENKIFWTWTEVSEKSIASIIMKENQLIN